MLRRDFLQTLGGATALVSAGSVEAARLTRANVCFITDEVSRNLRPALQFAAEYGIRQVELRNADGKYCFTHEPAKLKEIRGVLKEYGIRVAILSTPVLKCALPSSNVTAAARKEVQLALKDFPVPTGEQYPRQREFLRKAIEAARILETDKLRIFSYWRVEDREKEHDRIIEGISRAAEVAEKEKVYLCIENEESCNLADCGETAAVLRRLSSPYLGMNWDPANGYSTGESAYPEGFSLLDKSRIWHMHVKDRRPNPQTGREQICAVGDGRVPWLDIFRTMGEAGYTGALSMETHFSLNGSKEAASRRSMEGILKLIERQG
ncbi:MAG: sugar phosphate isomerase/epimerase [Acidobacteria bacterium]|nr:sugar phosphate isomerase/epimerase [Acidobacteriota bacterium]